MSPSSTDGMVVTEALFRATEWSSQPGPRVVFLDVETSSTRPDREVLELAVQIGLGDDVRSVRFYPQHPERMDPRATRVHGLTTEVLQDELTFQRAIDRDPETVALVTYLRQATVVVGYNVDFDLKSIDAELSRLDPPWEWDRSEVLVVDAYRLWVRKERRTLADAYRRFIGGELEGAHGAAVDVRATAEVLPAMMAHFEIGREGFYDWKALADMCRPQDYARRIGSHHLVWDDGRVVFGFGKHRGVDVTEVNVGYLTWCMRGDFPPVIKNILHEASQMKPDAFVAWVSQRYPPPMPDEVES